MGRPPAPWLDRAYEILTGGGWCPRDQVVAVMAKTVPPGRAYRRGKELRERAARSHHGGDPKRKVSDQDLVRRGARHICHGSLTDSTMVETRTIDGVVMVRLLHQERPVSQLVTAADALMWDSLLLLAHEAERSLPGVLEMLPLTETTRARLLGGVVDLAGAVHSSSTEMEDDQASCTPPIRVTPRRR